MLSRLTSPSSTEVTEGTEGKLETHKSDYIYIKKAWLRSPKIKANITQHSRGFGLRYWMKELEKAKVGNALDESRLLP